MALSKQMASRQIETAINRLFNGFPINITLFLCSTFITTMGLLDVGTPLPWEEAKLYADAIRRDGIEQFISIWKRLKDRHGDELLWGDEVRRRVRSF